MKFNTLLVSFTLNAQVFLGFAKKIEFHEVFREIAQSLAERHQSVAILENKNSGEAFHSDLFSSIASIPRVVVRVTSNTTRLELNSSALISVNSVKAV